MWVAPLPEGDWSKATMKQTGKDKKKDKDGQKEGSRKGESVRDTFEIAPMWRHAVLQQRVLVLKAADGVEERISLEGCEVLSVSGGPGPNRKWSVTSRCCIHYILLFP